MVVMTVGPLAVKRVVPRAGQMAEAMAVQKAG
jgi:hypothetical protein